MLSVALCVAFTADCIPAKLDKLDDGKAEPTSTVEDASDVDDDAEVDAGPEAAGGSSGDASAQSDAAACCDGGEGETDAAVDAAPASTITVVSATYGRDCGAPEGNRTEVLEQLCNEREQCTFFVDNSYGDPAYGCSKDFVIVWRCTGDDRIHQARHPPQQDERYTVSFGCPISEAE